MNDNISFINSFAGAAIGAWLSIFFSKTENSNSLNLYLITFILAFQLILLFWQWEYFLIILQKVKPIEIIDIRDKDVRKIFKNGVLIFGLHSVIFYMYVYILNFFYLFPIIIVIMFAWIISTIFSNFSGKDIQFNIRLKMGEF